MSTYTLPLEKVLANKARQRLIDRIIDNGVPCPSCGMYGGEIYIDRGGEVFGCAYCIETKSFCSICNEEYNTPYYSQEGEFCGCDNCVTWDNAEDWYIEKIGGRV